MMDEAVAVIAAVIGTPVVSAAVKTGSAAAFAPSFDCSKMKVRPSGRRHLHRHRAVVADVQQPAPATLSRMLLTTAVCAAAPVRMSAGSTVWIGVWLLAITTGLRGRHECLPRRRHLGVKSRQRRFRRQPLRHRAIRADNRAREAVRRVQPGDLVRSSDRHWPLRQGYPSQFTMA